MNDENNEERLFNVGFERLARWVRWVLRNGKLVYELTPDDDEARARLRNRTALYAFTTKQTVLYVGKTALTLAQRLSGYRTPGPTQSTNLHCHQAIRELLGAGNEVEILYLGGLTPLRWGEFELNIAAGLEDSLIQELTPPWNGGRRSAITESEVIEREALAPANEEVEPIRPAPIEPPAGLRNTVAVFQIELGDTYYRQGIINPGAKVASQIGADGETMLLRLGSDDTRGIQTIINRRANTNGSPRLYGRSAVADWFQEHFKLGDTVTAKILSPHEIVLDRPLADSKGAQPDNDSEERDDVRSAAAETITKPKRLQWLRRFLPQPAIKFGNGT